MNKDNKMLKSTTFPAVFFTLALIASILFRSIRSTWIFISKIVRFENFCAFLLSLMALDVLLLGILLALKLYGNGENDFSQKKAYKSLLVAASSFSALFFLFSFFYSLGIIFSESDEVYFLNLKKTITEGAPLIVIPFLAIFCNKLSLKIKKSIIAVILAITAICGITAFHPFTPYKITSTPMVIDNGKAYSIVFSTNDKGTAYAEYTYNGKDYKVFDNTCGRLNSDKKIHSISVPYEHLRNNTYKIGSTRVVEEFSYGSRRGKTVTSDEYSFTYNDSEEQTWLVISDWHTMCDTAYDAVNSFESDYDAVIMLGDASPGVDFEEQVITNIVQFGGNISKGTKPVIYARGNHETRGAYAKDLPVALGIEQFYYTTDIGPYSFVVLDSGEDKEDSHIEYGGMNDYETYRTDMIEWLKGVEVKNEKVIAVSHAWEISAVEEELSAAGWAQLDRLGARLMLSGHEHQCRYLGENNDKEKEIFTKYPDIIGYIDGGKADKDYIASMLSLNADGFEIKAIDNHGNEVSNRHFEW